MKKLLLDLDALNVESFPVGDGDGAVGTVLAREAVSQLASCLGYLTCGCACSGTDGVHACKSCGPSCYE